MALKTDPAPGPAATDPNPGAFDAASFKKEILDEMRKDINGIAKSLKNDLAKLVQPPPKEDGEPNPNPNPEPHTEPKPVIKDPVVNAELLSLRKVVDNLQKENKESKAREEEALAAKAEGERLSFVRSILNDITFKDQSSRDLIFRAHQADIKRDDSGAYIADSDAGPLPAKDYLANVAAQHSQLLASRGMGGAGAGNPGRRGPGNRKWTQADLTPQNLNALKSEERAELMEMAMRGEIAP